MICNVNLTNFILASRNREWNLLKYSKNVPVLIFNYQKLVWQNFCSYICTQNRVILSRSRSVLHVKQYSIKPSP